MTTHERASPDFPQVSPLILPVCIVYTIYTIYIYRAKGHYGSKITKNVESALIYTISICFVGKGDIIFSPI